MLLYNIFGTRFVQSNLIRRIIIYLLIIVALSSCLYSIFFLYSFPTNTHILPIEAPEEIIEIPDSLKHVPAKQHPPIHHTNNISSVKSLPKVDISTYLVIPPNISIPDIKISYAVFSLPPLHLVKTEPVVGDWVRDQSVQCGGAFEVRGSRLVIMRNVRLNPELAVGPRKGGEAVKAVINTPEEHEMFRYENGFFRLPCSSNPTATLGRAHHLGSYMAASDFSNKPLEPLSSGLSDIHSIAQLENFARQPISLQSQQYRLVWTWPLLVVTRYEYVNLFHTMTGIVNLFQTMIIYYAIFITLAISLRLYSLRKILVL